VRSTARKATIGGIVRLGDELFGLTVAHAFLDILEKKPTAQRGEIEFSCEYTSSDEGEEDDEDEEDKDLEVTSQGIQRLPIFRSMSNKEAGIVSPKYTYFDDSTSESSESDVIQSQSQDARICAPPSLQLRQEPELETAKVVLGRLSTISHGNNMSNLDWALVGLEKAKFSTLSDNLEVSTYIVGIAPSKAAVSVVTGSNGIINGTISESLTFMQLPNSIAFQEMWTVRLDGAICEWKILSSTSSI